MLISLYSLYNVVPLKHNIFGVPRSTHPFSRRCSQLGNTSQVSVGATSVATGIASHLVVISHRLRTPHQVTYPQVLGSKRTRLGTFLHLFHHPPVFKNNSSWAKVTMVIGLRKILYLKVKTSSLVQQNFLCHIDFVITIVPLVRTTNAHMRHSHTHQHTTMILHTMINPAEFKNLTTDELISSDDTTIKASDAEIRVKHHTQQHKHRTQLKQVKHQTGQNEASDDTKIKHPTK